MFNKFIINIRAKENWESNSPYWVLDRYFFIAVFLGAINIGGEFFINKHINSGSNNIYIQSFHIIIFFLFPSCLIFKSWGKSVLLCLSLFAIIVPFYFFIGKDIVPFYYSAFFIFSWFIFYLFFKKNREKIKDIFLGFGNWGKGVSWGILGGLFFCAHIFLVLWFSKNLSPLPINFPKTFTYLFLEISFSLIGMEFLLHYLLFLRLIRKNNFGFVGASIISNIFSLGIFLVNLNLNKNFAFIVGTSYYTLMQGFASCYLAYKTKSLFPSILFGLMISIFLSLIFIH